MVDHLSPTTVRDIHDMRVHGFHWRELLDAIAANARAKGDDIPSAAAEWIFGLVTQEPFADANRPTAVEAAVVLFRWNDLALDGGAQAWEELVTRTAAGELTPEELARAIAALAHRIASRPASSPQ